MYKNLHIPLLMLAAAAMIIAGCTISDRTYGGSHDEDVAFPDEPEEVNFFSNSDTWSQNDCIGIYMVETGTLTVVDNAADVAEITLLTGTNGLSSSAIILPQEGINGRTLHFCCMTDKRLMPYKS